MARLFSIHYYHSVVDIHNGILFLYEQELNYEMYRKMGETCEVILSEVTQACPSHMRIITSNFYICFFKLENL